ncbi:Holliday junction resolvase RuvX [Alphaproteobacteria bacterium]|nr:Holliday junction resolvase RuvX [Alphaproteobacteria bacterium]
MSPMINKSNNLIERLNTSQILVGLDVGFKTIGIAVSDRSLTIASPINTVSRKGTKKDLLKIEDFLKDYKIGGFVVGLPLSLDGAENQQTKKMRIFSKELQSFFLVSVEFWDERYSSDIIFKEMRRSDLSTTKIKKKLDQQSAAYILQGFLDRYRNLF